MIAAAACTQAMNDRLTRSISARDVWSAPPMKVFVAMSRVSCLRAQYAWKPAAGVHVASPAAIAGCMAAV